MDDGEDKVNWYFTVELIRVLGAISGALRRGNDQRLDRAIAKLASLDKMALRILDDEASTFVMLLHRVAIKYKESSIYNSIRSLSTNIQERNQHLEAFARTQFSRKRGIL